MDFSFSKILAETLVDEFVLDIRLILHFELLNLLDFGCIDIHIPILIDILDEINEVIHLS